MPIDLFAFMTEAPDGKYEVTKPTTEQINAVLPWLVDAAVTTAKTSGYCAYFNDAFPKVFSKLLDKNDPAFPRRFYNADGFDCQGRDRDGFDKDGYKNGYNRDGFDVTGFDQHGYNADGYNHRGYSREGFNRDGLDRYGRSREQVAADLVKGWSPEHVATVRAKLAARNAAAEAFAAGAFAETVQEPVDANA